MATLMIDDVEITGKLLIEATPEGGLELRIAPPLETLTYPQQCARRGAELLDQERPLWYRSIDLDHLDMGNSHRCILGQTYGYYKDGLIALAMGGHDAIVDLGFDVEYPTDYAPSTYYARSYGRLRDAWSEEITRRRNRG